MDLDAVAGRLQVVGLDQAGERGRPEPSDGAASGVEREMVLAVEPTR